jgi:CRP-like cAMP-binding protein
MAAKDQAQRSTASEERIALLEADPDLARHVASSELARACSSVTAPLVALAEGRFEPSSVFEPGKNPFAALILSGLVAREITVGGQPTLRLLGPGDLIHGGAISPGLLTPQQSYTAAIPTQVALLDDHFLHAVRHWPRLLTALVERTAEHHDATLIQLAISQQPRVEDRLVVLLRALAERWGVVDDRGVIVPLPLTHEALGRLIGARRPTVTLALKVLDGQSRLERLPDGAWLLTDVGDGKAGEQLQPLTGAARPRLLSEPPAPAVASSERPVKWTKLTRERLKH